LDKTFSHASILKCHIKVLINWQLNFVETDNCLSDGNCVVVFLSTYNFFHCSPSKSKKTNRVSKAIRKVLYCKCTCIDWKKLSS